MPNWNVPESPNSLDETSEALLPSSTDHNAVRHYVRAATSENTRKAYQSAIKQFEKWGGRLPTDINTVSRYIIDKADVLNVRTIDLHLTALSQWHRYQGLHNPIDAPQIKKLMEGVRRTHARPKQKAKALRLEHIDDMVRNLTQQPPSLKNTRDLAVVLAGFFGAFRRGELVAIQIDDLQWEPEGLLIRLPKSKTDQTSEGMIRALPFGPQKTCAATAIAQWIDLAKIKEGPLFRSMNRWGQIKGKAMNPGAINDLLKNIGKSCGFDFCPELSSHSFRRGFSTSAARESVAFELIKKQGGWKSDSVVYGYIEEGQHFTNNAVTALMEKLKPSI